MYNKYYFKIREQKPKENVDDIDLFNMSFKKQKPDPYWDLIKSLKSTSRICEVYSVKLKRWFLLPDLFYGRFMHGMMMIGDYLYVILGIHHDGIQYPGYIERLYMPLNKGVILRKDIEMWMNRSWE